MTGLSKLSENLGSDYSKLTEFLSILGFSDISEALSILDSFSKPFEPSKLSEISISDKVEYISNRAFEGCYNLQTVIVRGTVTDVIKQAFSHFNVNIEKNDEPVKITV